MQIHRKSFPRMEFEIAFPATRVHGNGFPIITQNFPKIMRTHRFSHMIVGHEAKARPNVRSQR